MDEYRVIFQVVPYLVGQNGFPRALNNEEANAVGLKVPALMTHFDSYINCLSLLKEKITRIQECLDATDEG